MLKQITKLEFIVNERTYQLLCENDSPIEHIKEALFQCQKYVGQIEDNFKAQMAAKASQEPIPENQEVTPDGDQQ